MNFCIDCIWMGSARNGEAICKRPGVGTVNPVTGGGLYPGCREERECSGLLRLLFGSCGPNGKYFKPK